MLAVDEHRAVRRFAGAGERNANVGMFRFTGAIHDAAHDSDIEDITPHGDEDEDDFSRIIITFSIQFGILIIILF